jgi:hypothetical protein
VSALRKLTVNPFATRFLAGLDRGLASSVDAFEVPLQRLPVDIFSGLKLDIEAMRADVGRAKIKTASEILKSGGYAKTS